MSVDVFAYNSKVYYVITEGAGFGDTLVRVPITGNETVLDALAQVNGLSRLSSKNIWIARPTPGDVNCDQILPVNWNEITKGAATATNYQVLPGDRIFIAENKVIALDTFIDQLSQPGRTALRHLAVGCPGRPDLQPLSQRLGVPAVVSKLKARLASPFTAGKPTQRILRVIPHVESTKPRTPCSRMRPMTPLQRIPGTCYSTILPRETGMDADDVARRTDDRRAALGTPELRPAIRGHATWYCPYTPAKATALLHAILRIYADTLAQVAQQGRQQAPETVADCRLPRHLAAEPEELPPPGHFELPTRHASEQPGPSDETDDAPSLLGRNRGAAGREGMRPSRPRITCTNCSRTKTRRRQAPRKNRRPRRRPKLPPGMQNRKGESCSKTMPTSSNRPNHAPSRKQQARVSRRVGPRQPTWHLTGRRSPARPLSRRCFGTQRAARQMRLVGRRRAMQMPAGPTLMYPTRTGATAARPAMRLTSNPVNPLRDSQGLSSSGTSQSQSLAGGRPPPGPLVFRRPAPSGVPIPLRAGQLPSCPLKADRRAGGACGHESDRLLSSRVPMATLPARQHRFLLARASGFATDRTPRKTHSNRGGWQISRKT